MSIFATKLSGVLRFTLFAGHLNTKRCSLHNATSRSMYSIGSKRSLAIPYKIRKYSSDENVTTKADVDTESIKRCIVDGKNDEALEMLEKSNFNTEQLYDVIRTASNSGNGKMVEKSINFLPESVRYSKLIDSKLQKICIELVQSNRTRSPDDKLDPYHLLMIHLPVPESATGDTTEYGQFLLKEMIMANENVSNILHLCDNLIESKRNPKPIRACFESIVNFNVSLTEDFLTALAGRQQLQPHYFHYLIFKAKNESELVEIIRFATKLNTTINMSSILSCIDSQYIESISVETVKALIDAGVRSDDAITTMLCDYLNKDRVEDAIEIVNITNDAIDIGVVVPALINYIKRSTQIMHFEHATNLIKKIQIHCKFDLAGKVAEFVCDKKDKNHNFFRTKRLLQRYEEFNLSISNVSIEEILKTISTNRMIQKELSLVLKKLSTDEVRPAIKRQSSFPDIDEKVNELERQLLKNKAKGLPIQGKVLHKLSKIEFHVIKM